MVKMKVDMDDMIWWGQVETKLDIILGEWRVAVTSS